MPSQRTMIRWEKITPVRFNPDAFREELVAGTKEVRNFMKKQFQRSVKTWSQDNKPDFRSKTGLISGQGPYALVYTEDRIYGFISGGTEVRYATMSKDFVSKTVPGKLDARRGQGRVRFISRLQPRPGIEARHFDRLVAKETLPYMTDVLRQRLVNAAQRSGHHIA